MSIKTLNSSSELDEVAKGSDVVVVWVFDSDGANKSFGKKLEEVAQGNDKASFYKAGTDDIKDGMKTHGLDPDWLYVFKDGQKVGDHREDHNAVDLLVKKHL